MAIRNGLDGLSMDLLLDRIILMAAFGGVLVANVCPWFECAIAKAEQGDVRRKALIP